jgi:hypothetical protein
MGCLVFLYLHLEAGVMDFHSMYPNLQTVNLVPESALFNKAIVDDTISLSDSVPEFPLFDIPVVDDALG